MTTGGGTTTGVGMSACCGSTGVALMTGDPERCDGSGVTAGPVTGAVAVPGVGIVACIGADGVAGCSCANADPTLAVMTATTATDPRSRRKLIVLL